MEKLILAIDCGTQSTRALIFDGEGRLLDKKKVEYEPYVRGEPGRAEQDARVYWTSLVAACRDLSSRRPELMAAVAGVAVTSQRDSMICLGADGEPPASRHTLARCPQGGASLSPGPGDARGLLDRGNGRRRHANPGRGQM